MFTIYFCLTAFRLGINEKIGLELKITILDYYGKLKLL